MSIVTLEKQIKDDLNNLGRLMIIKKYKNFYYLKDLIHEEYFKKILLI